LGKLPKFESDKLLVGLDTADDAAVYKLDDEKAIIQTLDFFTPIVDDPREFGRIAAANSLSDVYAMGGEPTIALNIVGFPNCLPIEILGEILAGGAEKVKEAGALLVGGHTIEDDEPKYGLSVTGLVHPDKVLSNANAQVGDVLILTKPIGIGVINTAIKGGMASEGEIQMAVKVMAYLNKDAANGMKQVHVNTCTDITGFGLIGHLYEVAKASDVTIELYSDQVPLLPGAKEHAEMGLIPAGMYKNMHYVGHHVQVNDDVEEVMEDLLHDPQTSGGLLISLPEAEAEKLLEIYKDSLETDYNVIGRVLTKEKKSILVK
jgi:selenide,water dikinase